MHIVNNKRQIPYSSLYFYSLILERKTAPSANSDLKSSLNVFLLIGEDILLSFHRETVTLQQCNDLKKNLSWSLCHLNCHVTPTKGKKTVKKLVTDSFLLSKILVFLSFQIYPHMTEGSAFQFFSFSFPSTSSASFAVVP